MAPLIFISLICLSKQLQLIACCFHKKLEVVKWRGLRATKIAEHAIFSCTFCPVYRGMTSDSDLPSYSHPRNLGSDFLFLGYLAEISHLAHHSLHQYFQQRSLNMSLRNVPSKTFDTASHCAQQANFGLLLCKVEKLKKLSQIHLKACHAFSSK